MINKQQDKRLSKFLSLLLRHKPETLKLNIDKNGWVSIPELLEKLNTSGKSVEYADIERIVANCQKQRFKLDREFNRIRANQGHSISIDLELVEKVPPPILFHGTAKKNLASIRKKGLVKGSRLQVHLSEDQKTAINVGSRYGFPVLLKVDSKKMRTAGFKFYQADNGVWLTDSVGVDFLIFPSS